MEGDYWRDILDSPLDDERPPARWRALGWGAAAVLVAAAVVFWVVLSSGGEGDLEGTAANTAATGDSTTATVLPGVIGYPEARYLPGFTAMEAGAVMLFGTEAAGSLTGDLYDEVWGYEAAEDTWRRVDTEPRPPARFDLGAAYDSGSGRVVIFGGGVPPCFPEATSRHSRSGVRGCHDLLGDTWLFDPAGGDWEQPAVETAPSVRSSHAMAYDPVVEKVVLFGGVTRTAPANHLTYLADTWVYDTVAGSWTEVTPVVSPGARGAHTMAYDAGTGRIVLFGGMLYDGDDPLLWAYDVAANTWAPIETTGGPGESWDGTLVDAPGRGMVLLDGQGVTIYEIAAGVTSTGIRWRNAVWHLDLGTGVWTERKPPGVPVQFQAAAVDPSSGLVVVWSGDVTLRYDPATDTWEQSRGVAGD